MAVNYTENSKAILVSVIIPVYNSELYLKECLESVLAQTYPYIQIILVDDGSSDNSPTICREYKKSDSRIELYCKENGGASSARNEALKHSRGTYVYFMDSDDILDETAVETLLKAAEESHADCVYFELENFSDGYKVKKSKCGVTKNYPVCDGNSLVLQLLKHKDFHAGPVLYFTRREIIEAVPRFEEGIMYEDELFVFLMLRACNSVLCLRKVLYRRRMRMGSVVTSTDKAIFRFNSMSKVLSRITELYQSTDKPDETLRLYSVRIGLLWLCICESLKKDDYKLIKKEALKIRSEILSLNGFGSRELKIRCHSHILWILYIFPGRIVRILKRKFTTQKHKE